MTISQIWTAVLPDQYLPNSTFLLIKNPQKRTPLYRWFKSNLDKNYEVTSSKYQYFDISHVKISKMWTAVHPV